MATTSADNKIRYVRCPKCSKVLIEFADVPVYKCGSCATILQAKHYKATRENGATRSVHIEQSDSPICNGSADNMTSFKGKEITSLSSAHASEATHIADADDSANSNRNLSPLSGDIDCHQRGKSPGTAENGTKEELSNTGQLESRSDAECTLENSNKLSRETSENLILSEKLEEYQKSSDTEGVEVKEGSDADISVSRCDKENSYKRRQDESILTETECCSIEVEKSPMQCMQVLRDKLEESSQPVRQVVAIEEDMVNEEHGFKRGSHLHSSQIHRESASSCSDGISNGVGDKYLMLSRESFRHLSVSDSVETEEKEGEGPFGYNELGDSLKSSRTGHTDKFKLNREGPSSRGTHVEQRGTSFDLSNFRSVQNWLGYTSPSKALSKGSTFHGDSFSSGSSSDYTKFKRLERDRLKILKTVDELRDQLSEVYSQRRGKRGSHSRGDPSLLSAKSGHQNHYPNLILHPRGADYQHTVRQQYQYQQKPLPVQSCCSCSDCSLEDHLPVRPNFHHKGHCRTCSQCPAGKTHDLELAKLQQREKTQPSKRYCRPLSGGAPFVICYNCLKVLQLPTYFCISRRKLQKLQCGACFEVLLFSFPSGATTRTPIRAFHPEFDSSTSASTELEMSSSFSEEHRLLSSMSFSTEAETLRHVSERSFEERNGTRGPSSLHQLMGYHSATEVLYQPSDNDEGYESAGRTRTYSYVPSEVSRISRD